MRRIVAPLALPVLLGALLVLPHAAYAQVEVPTSKAPTPEEMQAAEDAPLFAHRDPLALTLRADFSLIKKEDRSQDSEERPAVLEWTDPDGTPRTQDIEVRTRGIFRLAKRNCDFPPLRLDMKKEPSKGTLFEGQDKLKLVVTCKLGQSYWEQYVLSEYVIYRMFNVLTPLSFRVRLARVTYVDTSGKDDPFTRYAFLIEDNSEMAARNGGWKEDWQGGILNPALQDKRYAILVDIFQYMIGNTDWSGAAMHNTELVRRPDGAPPVSVPFDFDFSGIVDARYADPDPSLPIRSVRERLYRGFCPRFVNRQPEDYQAVYDLFQEKKEALYALWRGQEELEQDRIEDSLEYLDDFYEILDDPRKIESVVTKDCRIIG